MCGRFDIHTPYSSIAKHYYDYRYGVGDSIAFYNHPPGLQVFMIRKRDEKVDFTKSTWGYKPEGQDDEPTPINARIEKLMGPFWREAFLQRRCVIPANGWFEWRQTDQGKQPYYFTNPNLRSPEVLFLAGVWIPTRGISSRCAIITEPARGDLDYVHHRMPVVLDWECVNDWIDPSITDRHEIKERVKRVPAEDILWYQVSTRVNDVKNNDSSLIEPLSR